MKILDKAKIVLASLMGLAVMGSVAVSPVSAARLGARCPDGSYAKNLSACKDLKNDNNQDSLMSSLNTIINVAIGIIGFVAVAVIILGGFKYMTSSGDSNKVTSAKNTIMYGVIGLVIAILAFAIVNFVLSNIFQ